MDRIQGLTARQEHGVNCFVFYFLCMKSLLLCVLNHLLAEYRVSNQVLFETSRSEDHKTSVITPSPKPELHSYLLYDYG